MFKQWEGFNTDGDWTTEVNVREFIQRNYAPYDGDDAFLAGPTERTTKLWDQVLVMMKEELEKGIYDVETKVPSTITSHGPGYIELADCMLARMHLVSYFLCCDLVHKHKTK